jgi:hypothetical protein
MKSVDWDSDWRAIAAHLPPNWEALAAHFGIATRDATRPGTKVTDPVVVLRAVLHHACAGASLRITAALVFALLRVDISPVALHKWMVKAGPWLAALRAALLDTGRTFAPERWAGYEVVVGDGTTVARPGARGATARLHVAVRLADLVPLARRVTSTALGETLRRFAGAVRAGQLWILDRGYSHVSAFTFAAARGAALLVRLHPRQLPLFDAAGRAIDVPARLEAELREDLRPVEWMAFLHPDAEAETAGGRAAAPIAVRVVAVRLPPEKRARALARLEREYGKKGDKIPAESRRLVPYVVLVTSAPAERLTAAQLIELYRLRWQVELAIKRDKTICDLDALPNFRADTIDTWLQAKLLGIELARRLSTVDVPFPPEAVGVYALAPRAAALAAAAGGA